MIQLVRTCTYNVDSWKDFSAILDKTCCSSFVDIVSSLCSYSRSSNVWLYRFWLKRHEGFLSSASTSCRRGNHTLRRLNNVKVARVYREKRFHVARTRHWDVVLRVGEQRVIRLALRRIDTPWMQLPGRHNSCMLPHFRKSINSFPWFYRLQKSALIQCIIIQIISSTDRQQFIYAGGSCFR